MSEGAEGTHVPDEAWAPPRPDARATVTLPGYADFVEIARGGDSVVYRARQVALDRDVAVKVVDGDHASGGARFTRELQITLGLGRQHPHIVTVLDTGTTSDGRAAIVMDFHDLGSLHDRLATTGPLPVADVVQAADAVADALDFAHSKGILHRDVKPQNVLLLPTSYVLADFGIARMVDAGHTSSLERFSYRHASPQVLDGQPPTTADDIWSLGSTLFTVLDGRTPFAADDPADDTALAYLGRVRRGERRTIRRDDVPERLLRLVDACLQPDPAHRAPMAEVRREIAAVQSELVAWQPAAAQNAAPAAALTPPTPPTPAAAPATTPDPIEPEAPVAAPEPAEDPPAPAPAPVALPIAPSVAPASPPAPAATPTPAATSALAHLGPEAGTATPGREAFDSAPTGIAPDAAPTGGGDQPTPPPGGADHRGGVSRFRVVALIAVGLLLGTTVGVIAKVMGSGEEPVSRPTVTTATDVPVAPTTPTGSVTSKPYDIGNPKLAPTNLAMTDRGSSITLTWKDATDGVAEFLVVDVTEGRSDVKARLSAGSTSYTVEGVDPAQRMPCFQVVAIVFDRGSIVDQGPTTAKCTQR